MIKRIAILGAVLDGSDGAGSGPGALPRRPAVVYEKVRGVELRSVNYRLAP